MRIIGGEFRGRRLASPKGVTTRPITDRVKESLFNILYGRLDGACVIDLFCGTGSLGLEALSRGAAKVYFADRDRGALAALKETIRTFQVEKACELWAIDITARLAGQLQRADKPTIIFLDPPYPLLADWLSDNAFATDICEKIFQPISVALDSDGLVMLRTPRTIACPDAAGDLQLDSRREYGTMALNFYTLAAKRPAQP